MLCCERLTQPDCFVDSLLPHGPRQIFLFMLWKRSQDMNSGEPEQLQGAAISSPPGIQARQHLPQGVWLIICSIWDKDTAGRALSPAPSAAPWLWEVVSPFSRQETPVPRRSSRSQQLQGRERNFCAFLAAPDMPVGKAKATQEKRSLQGGRCSRISGEEGKWLQMEEPQGSTEDTGTTTKARAVPP